MNSTPFNIPSRTNKINDLVIMIARNAKDWQDNPEPGLANLILAMCEVAMSCPPAWFAREERLMIVLIVKAIYGDPQKFLEDINDESVSFYAKFAVEAGLPNNDIDYVLAELYRLHDKQFGSTT